MVCGQPRTRASCVVDFSLIRVAVWPTTAAELIAAQYALAGATPEPWTPRPRLADPSSPDPRLADPSPPNPWLPDTNPLATGACAVVFPRHRGGRGARGDPAWAAAAVLRGRRVLAHATITTTAGGPYEPGLLALREGAPLDAAIHALAVAPDVLLVDATGRDHPRGAGLAIHLGAVTGLPTVGVTHRPLVAQGGWPPDERGAYSPLRLDGVCVAAWLRTRQGARPLAVHPGWRTTLEVALGVVLSASHPHRTPEPLRHARRLARIARAANGNQLQSSAHDN
jgi:deoxyribonuclease V